MDEYKAAFASGLLETPESFDQSDVPFLGAIMAIADGIMTAGSRSRTRSS